MIIKLKEPPKKTDSYQNLLRTFRMKNNNKIIKNRVYVRWVFWVILVTATIPESF
jgi:hypothetical protein